MVGPNSYDDDYYSSSTQSFDPYSSPSVDCTLSLGNPSTRRSSNSDEQDPRRSDAGGYCGWEFQHQSNQHYSSNAAGGRKSSGSRRGGSSSGSGAGDALLARRCSNCDTTSTPLWRNGPRGPKSLCNACGIRYKKEQRRASATTTATTTVDSTAGGSDNQTGAGGYYNETSWSHQHFSPATAMANEYGFIDDVDARDSDSGIQFATWHFNVPGHAYQHC